MKDAINYLKANRSRLLPVGIVLFLALMTFVTLILTKINQELRSKAAADTAVLSFSPSSQTVAPNTTFNTAVILNTGNQSTVGADILVEFDNSKLVLLNITPPSPLNSTFKTYLPVTSNGSFDTVNVISKANSTGIVEFGMVSFDWASQAVTPAFNGVLSPVATLTFQTKANSSGTSMIRFNYVSATATTDSNVVLNPTGSNTAEDILLAPTSTVTVNISSTASPQPTPSAGPSATPGSASATFLVKFERVTAQRPEKEVLVSLISATNQTYSRTFLMTSNTSGVYSNSNDLATNMIPGTYNIFVKGPAHLTRKFSSQNITSGSNTYDLTSLLLLPGDIQSNDKVDIFDYSFFVADFGPRMPTGGSKADFDFDNDVDIFDYSFFVGNFNKTGDQ